MQPSYHIERAIHLADLAQSTSRKIKEEVQATLARLKEMENEHARLHQAYLRLRALIPNAFDTPYAPTPAEVWKHTEECLEKALGL